MCTLRAANRQLLAAIETPPDTGDERRLDRLAAAPWARAHEDGPALDPGCRCRLRHALSTVADRSHEPRARHLRRARRLLDEHATEQSVRRCA